MAAVSAAEGDVGLFELCNPHLLATDLLQVTSWSHFQFDLISNLSLSLHRDCSSPCIYAHRNVKKQFTWLGPTYPQGILHIKNAIAMSELLHCLIHWIQASEEETKERWGEWEERRWRGCCWNPDWWKLWAAEVGRGEAERATESQIWRHPCKGGRGKQLKASQNYLAIIVMKAKLFLPL